MSGILSLVFGRLAIHRAVHLLSVLHSGRLQLSLYTIPTIILVSANAYPPLNKAVFLSAMTQLPQIRVRGSLFEDLSFETGPRRSESGLVDGLNLSGTATLQHHRTSPRGYRA